MVRKRSAERHSTDTERESSGTDQRPVTMGRVWQGLEGGALATLVMTAYRLPVTRSLPPTAEFWAQYVSRDDPYDHPVVALVLHAVYGVAAGGVFATLLSREPVDEESDLPGPPSPSGEVSVTLLGFLWGLLLSVFGESVVLGALLDVDPDDRFAFHVGHVLYGITLGAWVGTRTTDS
jgi:hypothetical protein